MSIKSNINKSPFNRYVLFKPFQCVLLIDGVAALWINPFDVIRWIYEHMKKNWKEKREMRKKIWKTT